MHQAVVDQGVDDAVEENAEADPGARFPCRCAHYQRAADGEHRDAHHRADDAVEIVFLERLVMRLVMIAVPAPAETVHDIFVARPCDKFHRDDRHQYGSNDGKNAHSAKIGAIERILKPVLTCTDN